MLDWLRRLMAGDQSAAPADAEVERDEQGRVTRVQQTLSPAGQTSTDTPPPATNPALAPVGALAPRLDAASAWLVQQNIALARDHGIGLEENFSVDQTTGLLTLHFPDRPDLSLPATIIGSFDPRDRSFMWGWANSSVHPEMIRDAAALRALADEGSDPSLARHPALTTPVQTVTFDTLMPLLALAAQVGGADGVYRCITNGSTSIFLAIRAGTAAAQTPADPALLEQAGELVRAQDAEMLPIDAEYHAGKHDGGNPQMGGLIERKVEIYHRYWAREDDYWLPSSLGWPSDHDASRHRINFTVPHPGGGALVVAVFKTFGDTIHRVERIDGAPKITDILLDWGKGFVWPKPVAEEE
ncbi:hypothetical protein GRI97_10990 [Altererythrobacter xixiisoli]|uniref:Uncharacterized protein n=1 Tax=Croceibacterium xixiisoli TaxID=1476466 RepID=A0A6I4TUB8_9SPHN|nr:DUF6882 domain-containing protein [Croceibacterium xixiisoli]MXO99514.1 hypothetical protein [Croceibacterium xixiisoli]